MENNLLKKINRCLHHAHDTYLTSEHQIKFLGEGAWHQAFLIHPSTSSPMVIRFPKAVAYGKEVLFDKRSLLAEYGGTAVYYQHANLISWEISPMQYDYHVERDFTYTIESYMGEPLKLAEMDRREAYQLGKQLGVFFRGKETHNHGIRGYGRLVWTEEGVAGEHQKDYSGYIKKQASAYQKQLEELGQSHLGFDREKVSNQISNILANRQVEREPICFTNRDVSPENILYTEGRVRVIDPNPILSSGMMMAGQCLHHYHSLFAAYHDTPRYEKHQFHRHENVLRAIGNGFLDSYTNGSQSKREAVRREQYLHLFSDTYAHYKSLQENLDQETEIRMGDRRAISRRLQTFLRQLDSFSPQ